MGARKQGDDGKKRDAVRYCFLEWHSRVRWFAYSPIRSCAVRPRAAGAPFSRLSFLSSSFYFYYYLLFSFLPHFFFFLYPFRMFIHFEASLIPKYHTRPIFATNNIYLIVSLHQLPISVLNILFFFFYNEYKYIYIYKK